MSKNSDTKFLQSLRLSNQLVRGSHVSFESALFFHRLIDKAPNETLAVGETKKIIKPLGVFRYYKLNNCFYSKGVEKISVGKSKKIRIASKEKAIADILVRRTTPGLNDETALEKFLVEMIGIKKTDLIDLDGDALQHLRVNYNKMSVGILSRRYSKVDGGRIWMVNFPRTTTEEQLLELFQPFGEVLSLKIRTPSKLFPMAFVCMKNPLEGKQAIRDLDGTIYSGATICVKESKELPRPEKYIYALLSFEKKECYIGETCDFKKRVKAHLALYGCEISALWISYLSKKPIPIILEKIEKGYDGEDNAIYLETVWRLVAAKCGWDLVNPPHLSGLQENLIEAVESRITKWPVPI